MSRTALEMKEEIHQFYVHSLDASINDDELTAWLLKESMERTVSPLELVLKVKDKYPHSGMTVLEGLVIQRAGDYSILDSLTEDVVSLVRTLLTVDYDHVIYDDQRLWRVYQDLFIDNEVSLKSIDRHFTAKNLINKIVTKAIVAKMLRGS